MSKYSAAIFVYCLAVGDVLSDDHVSTHKADVDVLRSFGAYVRITPTIYDNDVPLPPPRIAAIIVSDSWLGKDSGVNHIESIFSDAPKPPPILLFIGEPKISADRISELRKNIPKSSFRRRSAVTLGIMVAQTETVRVTKVTPDSSADMGGIRRGDTIIAANNTKITDFKSLTDFLIPVKAGQTVQFTIKRDTDTIRLPVKMKAWAEL